jgi:hypothetical protein
MQNIKATLFLLVSFLFFMTSAYAQHLDSKAVTEHHDDSFSPHFRAAILIGHTLITPENVNTRLFVPSWGLDLEYWPTHKFGVGLHSDIELQDFVVLDEDQEEIERKEPFIITLDGLYRPWKGLVLMGGPGIEIEKNETFNLFRIGVEYEVKVSHIWDLFPTFFYDHRLDGYSTISIGLGVGAHF